MPTAAADAAAPQNLHAFTLRANEAITHTFTRTPSFAWIPVAGAKSYDFELSRSRNFPDNGVVWQTPGVKSPAAAVPLAIPWATRGSQVTWATSLKLPLSPGTWFYRVRGLDYLMTGSKPQMSWLDPVRIVVTKPRFRVVH